MLTALRPAVAVALLALSAFVATQDERGATASRKSNGPLVVISGNEHGFIRPCGCSKPALGGVHRRADAIAELKRSEPKLAAVSVGDFLAESNREQELKFESFLMSLTEMEYAAFVPGAGEFKLGKRFVSDGRGLTPVPFVVANAAYPDEAPFEKSAKLADTGGILIGLVEPLPAELGVTVTPAADALKAAFASNTPAAFVLVAYNGPLEDVKTLASVVPEAARKTTYFVIPGISDTPIALDPVLGMPVLTAGMKGKAIGLLRPGAPRVYEQMRLEEERKGTPSVEKILEAYRKSIRDELLMKNVAKVPAVGLYVGDKKCAECHKEAYDALETTPHQRAMKSLAKTHDDYDPECVKCHVTGWATRGGFVDHESTPARMNVNCEACHGPGEAHSADTKVKTPGGKVDKNTCLRCHDPDNSPHFKFDEYWPRVEHGLDKAATRPK